MNNKYLCINCGGDYREHQTVIADTRKRCVCLNCWDRIKSIGGAKK